MRSSNSAAARPKASAIGRKIGVRTGASKEQACACLLAVGLHAGLQLQAGLGQLALQVLGLQGEGQAAGAERVT